MGNILIADDNKQITSILSEYAKKEGFTSYVEFDGIETMNEFQKREYDMVLLDVMMPKKDGFELCREIRKKSNVPIIMITARGEDFERIMGLDIGADDYIVKPFQPSEVMARIRAILRRVERTPSETKKNILTIDDLMINMEEYKISINGEAVVLTKKEIEILWVLANSPNKVFTRDNLLNSVWGYDYYGDNRTVDSHIKRLRAKLDAKEHKHWQVKTVWGTGYKFEVIADEE